MHIVSLIQCHLSVIIGISSPSVPFGSDALNQLKIPTAWAPKARRATSQEVQAWCFSLYYWSNQLFCSPHSLCSNHSIWPHMDSYVPNCHGDISPSLMVLFISIFSYFRCQPICCKSPQISTYQTNQNVYNIFIQLFDIVGLRVYEPDNQKTAKHSNLNVKRFKDTKYVFLMIPDSIWMIYLLSSFLYIKDQCLRRFSFICAANNSANELYCSQSAIKPDVDIANFHSAKPRKASLCPKFWNSRAFRTFFGVSIFSKNAWGWCSPMSCKTTS